MIQDRIDATRAALEASCLEAKAWISGDGRIGEEVAAWLLGYTVGSLANMRLNRRGPEFYRIGGAGHKVTYRLDDLAAWIEARRGYGEEIA